MGLTDPLHAFQNAIIALIVRLHVIGTMLIRRILGGYVVFSLYSVEALWFDVSTEFCLSFESLRLSKGLY